MVLCLFVVALSLFWLLIETKFLTIRLLVGKISNQTYLLPVGQPVYQIEQTCSRTKFEQNRYKGMNYYEHKEFEKQYANYLESEQRQRELEYKQTELERLEHHCPICDKTDYDDTFKVTQQTFLIGNSKFTIRACFECMCKRINDVWDSQFPKHKPKPVEYKPELNKCGKRFTDWSEEDYPHTIELIVDNNESIHLNGNYKPGMIKDFIKSKKLTSSK